MNKSLYQVGGSLLADSPSYIVRAADHALYEALRSGEFCYVLNSRQMGKSSLRVQVMRRLKSEGLACTSIDMTLIREQQVTVRQWYGSLMRSLVTDLELGYFNLSQWWKERENLSAIQCFSEFVEQVLLAKESQAIVIFIDEIDSILNLEFKDDFFALIRAFYNKRSDCVEYRRLTFCLLGVAAPNELIGDHARTPFNIGRAIDLCGFQLEEGQALEKGMVAIADDPHIVLKEILNWTGGQPFLTQKLCQLVADQVNYIAAGEEETTIHHIVQQQIIENWEVQDNPEHLRTIRDRLLYGGEQRAGRLLGLCQQITKQGSILIDNSIEQIELRLTGLIVRDGNQLKLYNRIYESVFNSAWVTQELAKLRPYSAELEAWLASGMKDESRLLRGKALQKAMSWSAGKRLNEEDYRFFGMSQELELRDTKRKLAVEAEAKKILKEAKQKAEAERSVAYSELEQAKKKTEKIVRKGRKVVISIFIITVVVIGLVTIAANLEIQKANRTINLMQDSSTTLRQFEKGVLPQIDAVFSAMRTAQQAKKLKASEFSNLILQQILDQTLFKSDHYLELTRISHSDIRCISFNSDGKTLTSVSTDGTAELWNLNGKQLKQIKPLESDLVSANCSSDGTKFATISSNGKVQIWDFKGNLLRTLNAESRRAIVVEFNRDRDIFATGTENGWINLWNLQGKRLLEFQAHQKYIYQISFSPDGQTFATASEDKTVKLWNLKGEKIREFPNDSASGTASGTAVNFSPDGTKLATAWSNGTVKVISLDGRVLQSFSVERAWIHSVQFTADSQKLIVGLSAGDAQIWDLNGRLQQKLKGRPSDISEIVIHPDGKRFMTVAKGETAHLWNLNTEASQKFKRTIQGHRDSVQSISFHPNGQQFITASSDLTARLWTIDGQPIRDFKVDKADVLQAEFSPDGSTIAMAYEDRTVRLWNVHGQLLQTWRDFSDRVFRVRFSPDGSKLAIALRNGEVQLRSRQGKILQSWKAHPKAVSNLNFNHAGTQLATASYDRTARLWNLEGQMQQVFQGHTDLLLGVSFSPDDQKLVTAAANGSVRLWTLKGQIIQDFRASSDAVRDVQFSPDGQQIATASDDGVVRFWNLESEQTQAFSDHRDRVYGIRFSPDGSMLASASSDRNIVIRSVGTADKLMAQACQWLGNYLKNYPGISDQDRALCNFASR